MIKAVLFDVGGVLATSPFGAIVELERQLGLPEHFFFRAIVKGKAFKQLEDGTLTLEEFNGAFERECDGRVSGNAFLQHLGRSLRPRPAFRDAVLQCKAQGYRVGIITNNWAGTLSSLLATFPADTFDVVVESYRVKQRKPHPAIYTEAHKRLQELDATIAPAEIVFLDDIPANVRAARALGWHALLVPRTDAESALAELAALLRAHKPAAAL